MAGGFGVASRYPAAEQGEVRSMTDLMDLQAKTLGGDVRDLILGQIKVQRAHWSLLSERDQQAVIDEVATFSMDLVSRVVDLVSANGLPFTKAILGSVAISEKGIVAKV